MHRLLCVVMSSILSVCGSYHREEVLPRLITLFQSRKSHVRLILLQHLEYYAELCSENDLEEIVLPETLIGLHEEDDLLVAATLKGLGALVPLLGAEMVMGKQRKNVFSDSRPGRTTSGLERVKSSGSVSTEGSGLLRAPEPPFPLSRPKAVSANMSQPVMSKEEQRQLRREEQERKRQQKRAQKVERDKGTHVHRCMQFADVQLLHGGCNAVLSVTLSMLMLCTDMHVCYMHSRALMNLCRPGE